MTVLFRNVSLFLIFILIFIFSCNNERNWKKALIGLWSIDSIYCNNEFSNKRFWSNFILFEDDKISFPNSADESYTTTYVFCKKAGWTFNHNDTLGYYLTFSNKCISNDTIYVRFINDKKLKQLRFELKFKTVVYYGRKSLFNYSEEERFFQDLESFSKILDISDIKINEEDSLVYNRFKL